MSISRTAQFFYVRRAMERLGQREFRAAPATMRARGVNVFDPENVFTCAPHNETFECVTTSLMGLRNRGCESSFGQAFEAYLTLKLGLDAPCCYGSGDLVLAEADGALYGRCDFCDSCFDLNLKRLHPPALRYASRRKVLELYGPAREAEWPQGRF